MNIKEYNYSYANRIGNVLTEPFYKLYKADTKYLETSDLNVRPTVEKVLYAINMLLLNLIAIPLSLPLWLIGKTIVQYTSPKINYSLTSPESNTSANETSLKVNLLSMVKDHKESTIIQVFSHGSWYSLFDYRMEPNREFGAIPGLESIRDADSILEKIHSLLEQTMILTKLRDAHHLIESLQKRINQEASDNYNKDTKNSTVELFLKHHTVSLEEETDLINTMLIKNPQYRKMSSGYDYRNYLVELVSKNHTLPPKEATNFVDKNFYSGNSITYQGVNCLLRGIGILS